MGNLPTQLVLNPWEDLIHCLMKNYKIERLFKSKNLVLRENGSLFDIQAGVSVGASEYADEIKELRLAQFSASTEENIKKAKEAITLWCSQHFIDGFTTEQGQEVLFVNAGEMI